MSKSLAEWLSYLEYIHPKTIELGLTRIAAVRERMALNPCCPVIVVGGTNGKGSTCALLESILVAAGYRVGCHTSPHFLRYNERVRVNKQQVADAELCVAFEQIEQARAEIPLTYFEFGVLAAVSCFNRHQVDVMILEVGLGGRLDAVNVFDADCSVVTSVDLDHMDYLGDTREKIAYEKAGIYRAGKVAICADPDVPLSLKQHAAALGAELWCINSEFSFEVDALTETKAASLAGKTIVIQQQKDEPKPSLQWNFSGPAGKRCALPFPALRGDFQLYNASAVLAVLDAMKASLPVNMGAIRRGLTEVELAGRFQVIPGKPLLILDVAHNPHAATSLAHNLAQMPKQGKTWAVFSMLKDKDIAAVVRLLDPYIDVWLVAGLEMPRGLSGQQLAELLQSLAVSGELLTFETVSEAVKHGYKQATENDRIAAFGSFFTVSQVMAECGISC